MLLCMQACHKVDTSGENFMSANGMGGEGVVFYKGMSRRHFFFTDDNFLCEKDFKDVFIRA